MGENKKFKLLKIEKLYNENNCANTIKSLENGDENNKKFFENLKWLTSNETIEYLRLPSVGALRQLVYRRQIPYYKLGRKLLFNRIELDDFIEASCNRRRAA